MPDVVGIKRPQNTGHNIYGNGNWPKTKKPFKGSNGEFRFTVKAANTRGNNPRVTSNNRPAAAMNTRLDIKSQLRQIYTNALAEYTVNSPSAKPLDNTQQLDDDITAITDIYSQIYSTSSMETEDDL